MLDGPNVRLIDYILSRCICVVVFIVVAFVVINTLTD